MSMMPPSPGTVRGSPEHELQARQAWATTFFARKWDEHAAEAPGIIEHLYALKSAASKNIASEAAVGAKSMEGLFESPLDLFDQTEHPGLKKLVAFIDKSVRSAVAHVNGRQVHPNKLKVTFNESWYHMTNGGGFHAAHYHPGCSWCGIYYMQAADCWPSDDTGAGNGINRFFSPIGCGAIHLDYGNRYMEVGRLDITPQDGLLFLFPAHILHNALPYTGDRDRIILSFNSVTNVIDS
jgi:uncharacterized protein (TIGR02466 family)